MEKILILYPQGGMSTATDIQQQIKKAGYASTMGCVSLSAERNLPSLIIAVVNADSISDEGMVKVLDEASEKRINVVPYVCAKLQPTITGNFFLDEHVWIDAVDQSQKQALGDLADCLKNNFGTLSKKAVKKTDAPKISAKQADAPKNTKAKPLASNEKLYRNLFFAALAVIVLLVAMLVSGHGNMGNREANNQQANLANSKAGGNNMQVQLSSTLRRSEESLVGRWVASDYSDNRFRATHQDSVEHKQLVDFLLSGNAMMIINSDKTFSRLGFSADGNPENGVWEYDPQSKYLKLQPNGINQYDVVQIQDITDSKMVIVVQEKVDNSVIITKITFTKN